MDQFIGMGFQHFVPVVLALGCAAKDAFSVYPAVGNPLVANIALRIVKAGHRIHAVGVLAAMQILELRMSGDTLEEIAEKLGYKNHSGVLKRIRKIGQAYEAYTGVDYGFESGKIIG